MEEANIEALPVSETPVWTASVVEKPKRVEGDATKLAIQVVYTNGEDTETETYKVFPTDSIDSIVSEKIKKLNAVEDFLSTTPITAGPIAPSTDVPVPTTDPDREKFVKNFVLLRKMNVAVAQGIMDVTDQTYADHLALVKDEFKSEYLDIVSGIAI